MAYIFARPNEGRPARLRSAGSWNGLAPLTVAALCQMLAIPAFGQPPSTTLRPTRSAAVSSSSVAPDRIDGHASDELGALTLRQTLRIGNSTNRDIAAARATLDAARGMLIAAGKRPNPTLTLGTGPGLLGQYRPRDADMLVSVSQLIERGNKRALRTQAASYLEDAACLDAENVRRQFRLALATAYFALKQEQERVALAQATQTAFTRSREAAALRLKVGDLSRVDVVRLGIEERRSENDVVQAHSDLGIARNVLAALLGYERESASIRVIDAWPVASERKPTPERIEGVLETRPDVQAAIARLSAEEAQLQLAQAQRIRDVTLALVSERNLPANGGTTLGVQLSMPLLINNEYDGEIARAEAELRGSRIDLDKTRASARVEVARALEQFDSARVQLARYEEKILPDATWVVEAAEFAYKKGAIPLTDLLDARRQYYAAQRQLLELRMSFATADAALASSLEDASLDH